MRVLAFLPFAFQEILMVTDDLDLDDNDGIPDSIEAKET
jgi:hypothetical protein